MTKPADELTKAVTAAWQLRASGHPQDAVALATSWIGRDLPRSAVDMAELGELYRCASLCAENDAGSLWRERAILLFALANCGNGLATTLIPAAFGLLKDRDGGATVALNWLDGMTSLVGTGCTDAGPATSLTQRLYWEKVGFLQHEAGRFEEAIRSYDLAEAQIDARVDPRAAVKVRLGKIRPRWQLSGDHAGLLAEQRNLVDEIQVLGDQAADLLVAAEANLEAMQRDKPPAHPYEVV